MTNLSFKSNEDFKFSDFWNLEHIGIKDSSVENDDDPPLQKFNDTIKYENNRYYVTCPWKELEPALASNYNLAGGRLKQ